jgi:hypothetical protein
MKSERSSSALRELPPAKVFVVGLRKHGTSEVIAALASIDRPEGLVRFDPRVVEAPPRGRDGMISLINDFGPTEGSARLRSIETQKRRLTLYECVNGVQALMMAGTRRCDAVLWVHSARDDVELDPIAQMLDGAVFLSAKRALVFITDAHEASPERLDAVERDARELLSAAGFDADECPVVRGTGPVEPNADARWKSGAQALREALDEAVPYVELDPTFAMAVDDVFSIRGRGTVVTGQVLRGAVRLGDTIDIVRPASRATVKVTGIEISRRLVDIARPRDNIGILLDPCERDDVARGDLLVTPGEGLRATSLRLRGYAWRAPAQPLPIGVPTRIVNLEPLFTIVDVDRAIVATSAFSMQVQCDAPRPLLLDQAIWLRDNESPFAVAFIDAVLD